MSTTARVWGRSRIGMIAAAIALSSVILAACGASDVPGFLLTVHNDLPRTVNIDPCIHNNCESFAAEVRLKPGADFSSPQTADGALRPFKVTTLSGQTLGCMPFQFHRNPPPQAVIDISRMVPCGGTGGSASVSGRDWPFARD